MEDHQWPDTRVVVSFQGEIRYEAIGVYPATSFFAVNAVSGAVTVTTDLRNDALLITSYTVSLCLSVCLPLCLSLSVSVCLSVSAVSYTHLTLPTSCCV